MKKIYKEYIPPKRQINRKACVNCIKTHKCCIEFRPCKRCEKLNIECFDVPSKRRGPKKKLWKKKDFPSNYQGTFYCPICKSGNLSGFCKEHGKLWKWCRKCEKYLSHSVFYGNGHDKHNTDKTRKRRKLKRTRGQSTNTDTMKKKKKKKRKVKFISDQEDDYYSRETDEEYIEKEEDKSLYSSEGCEEYEEEDEKDPDEIVIPIDNNDTSKKSRFESQSINSSVRNYFTLKSLSEKTEKEIIKQRNELDEHEKKLNESKIKLKTLERSLNLNRNLELF